jgi:hypothetical protein
MNFVNDIVPFQSQEKQEVVIEKIVRNKRKCVTVVKGLELFGELFTEKEIFMSEMVISKYTRMGCYMYIKLNPSRSFGSQQFLVQ